MAETEHREDVQWLFDQLDTATCEGQLDTVVGIIKLEIGDGNEYTKDESMLGRLRHCFSKNRKRVRDEQAKAT